MSDQFSGYAPQAGGYPADGGRPSYGQQWDAPAAQPSTQSLQGFVAALPPDADVVRPSEDFLAYAEGRMPAALVSLWRDHGIGFYGDQRVAVLDPGEWMQVLQTWLGPDVTSVPIVATSFGHLYHYDQVGGQDRIQCLDPHFQSNTVVSNDLVEFFEEHLPGGGSHVSDLEGPRGGARQKLGRLETGEIYYFVPMLALGGTVSPDALAKGPGQEHLAQIHRSVGQSRG